jgi:hypothetical protein
MNGKLDKLRVLFIVSCAGVVLAAFSCGCESQMDSTDKTDSKKKDAEAYYEPFGYADGPLAGQPDWAGAISNTIRVADSKLRLSNGRQATAYTTEVSASGLVGVYFELTQRTTGNTGNAWWTIRLYDQDERMIGAWGGLDDLLATYGENFASSGHHTFSGVGVTDLVHAIIDFKNDRIDFYFNGNHSSVSISVDSVSLEKILFETRPVGTGEYLDIDSVRVTP